MELYASYAADLTKDGWEIVIRHTPHKGLSRQGPFANMQKILSDIIYNMVRLELVTKIYKIPLLINSYIMTQICSRGHIRDTSKKLMTRRKI